MAEASFGEMMAAVRQLHASETGRVRHLERLAAIVRQGGDEPAYVPRDLRRRLEVLADVRDLMAAIVGGRAQVTGWPVIREERQGVDAIARHKGVEERHQPAKT